MITISNGLIMAVERYRKYNTPANLVDVGNAAIVPGMVNAHTHLEFSHLTQPLGHPGISFSDWIRLIVAERKNANLTGARKSAVINLGLHESHAAGVCCVGDIATPPICPSAYSNQMHQVIFHEQLGRVEVQFSEKVGAVASFLNEPVNEATNCGISPHAPYSVHPRLLRDLCELAQHNHALVAMHVSETEAERELLEHQTGQLVDLLKDFGVWDRQTFLPPTSILEILQTLSFASRSLVIHGNYLSDSEIEFMAKRRQRMSIVYCPRTHQYFQHRRYPLSAFRSANLNIAIGTDSRASNPDLNLFAELQFVAQHFPEIPALEILGYGTLNGATALGLEYRLGSISSGKQAALNRIEPAASTDATNENLDWLLASDSTCARLC
jgi:cytosine/adenosine deaminase-related metal-dependent hydrolase